MTLIIGSTAQVAIEMTCSGQKIFNVIGIHMPGPYLPPDVVAAVKTAWEAAGGPLSKHPAALSVVGYHAVDLASSTGAIATLSSGAVGGVAGDLSLLSSCALVKLNGGTRQRRANGRLFHGPITEGQMVSDGRTLGTSDVTGLTAAYTQFKNAMTTANMPWVVISRKYSETHDVQSVSVRSVCSSQDRRLRG